MTSVLAEREGRTTLTLAAAPLDAPETGRRAFAAGHASMRQGYGGTLDQPAAYLAGA